MAAGRQSVLGKRDSYNYKHGSVKEFDYYKIDSGKEDREEGEILVDGDEILPPLEKRRKFSPIVWDLAKNSSKDGVTKSSVDEQSPEGDGVLSGSSKNSSCVDEESDMQGWNITKSKWACDDDLSPMADDCKYKLTKSKWASDELSPMADDDKYKQRRRSSSAEVGGSSDSTITRSDVDEGVSDDSPSDAYENSGMMHVERSFNMCQSCRSVSEFEMIKKINEGTYGVVYKAKDKKTGEIVALKKVKMDMEREGFPISALREMNILLSLDHPSIVDVKEVVVDDNDYDDGTYMVMEHMQYDLKQLLESKSQPFSMGEIKSFMKQLLEGVKYLHDNWILHRDLKTSNILLNKDGKLKICDFGMSRQYGSPLKQYTSLVVTLWYRSVVQCYIILIYGLNYLCYGL
jgi:cell division cycle 2-like